MKRLLGALFTAALFSAQSPQALADGKEATAVLDKAIAALGGAEKLARAGTATWKVKLTVSVEGNDSTTEGTTTIQGIDRHRIEFEGTYLGRKTNGVTVVVGDKGWRKLGDE
jgi:hypothetical protein